MSPSSEPGYTLHKGVIRYKDRIWLPAVSELQEKIILALHASPAGGHSGIPVTLRRVKQLFFWKGMKASVKKLVAECVICQKAKPDRAKYPGLLQPLPVPDEAFQMISLDFIEGLPRSGRYNCILVVVDKFSRYAHFIPLSHPFTASTVAAAFMDNIHKLHGMPESIISDRDRIFTSAFWKELFRRSGTFLRMSSSYHPQTDGQTERVNQCLEAYLRCFCHACPSKWLQWLPLSEYWYNTSLHSALGKSPFEVLYNRSPRQLGLSVDDTCPIPDLDAWLAERDLMTRLLKQHLERVRQRMKRQADKKRSERTFEVGDMVFLKLQPYI
jgi:transposase InsO family protein